MGGSPHRFKCISLLSLPYPDLPGGRGPQGSPRGPVKIFYCHRPPRAGMRLDLDRDAARAYQSQAQQARVVTQRWAADNMYCPACESPRLEALVEGNPS
jgi:hypothetical protein